MKKVSSIIAVGALLGSSFFMTLPANAANHTKNDIKTSDRAAVSKAYMQKFVPATKTNASGWKGNVNKCQAGSMNANSRNKTLDVINFYRGLNGLEKVWTTNAANNDAQRAALIMHARGNLTHSPSKSSKCFTQAGYNGASKGNLFGGKNFKIPNAAASPKAYMDDYGKYNDVVGHRRWIMNPKMKYIGIGTTTSFNAIKVMGVGNHAKYANPTWVTFPNANYSPVQLEPNGRWSVTRKDADFKKASITVYNQTTKKNLKVRKERVVNGYGDNTIAFQVSNITKPKVGTSTVSRHKVTIKNVKVKGKNTSYTYYVNLFDGHRAR